MVISSRLIFVSVREVGAPILQMWRQYVSVEGGTEEGGKGGPIARSSGMLLLIRDGGGRR